MFTQSMQIHYVFSNVCLSVCLSVCLLACLLVCLSVCLSVCLPACLSVCPSVCLCLSARIRVCQFAPSPHPLHTSSVGPGEVEGPELREVNESTDATSIEARQLLQVQIGDSRER